MEAKAARKGIERVSGLEFTAAARVGTETRHVEEAEKPCDSCVRELLEEQRPATKRGSIGRSRPPTAQKAQPTSSDCKAEISQITAWAVGPWQVARVITLDRAKKPHVMNIVKLPAHAPLRWWYWPRQRRSTVSLLTSV